MVVEYKGKEYGLDDYLIYYVGELVSSIMKGVITESNSFIISILCSDNLNSLVLISALRVPVADIAGQSFTFKLAEALKAKQEDGKIYWVGKIWECISTIIPQVDYIIVTGKMHDSRDLVGSIEVRVG